MYRFFKKKPLMITLNEKSLSISLSSNQAEHIPLENIEIQEDIIHNPNVIARHINAFMKKYNIKKTQATLNIPWLEQASAGKQPFITLQAALCMSKSNAKLKKIVCGQTPYDYLVLLKKPASSPYLWLGYSFFIGFIAIGISYKTYQTLHRQELTYRSSIQALERTSQKQTAVNLQGLKKQKNTLEATLKKASLHKKLSENNTQLLKIIAQTIPHDTVVTKLLVEHQKEAGNSNQQTITIKGLSKNIKSVSQFLNGLHQLETLKNLTITSLQQQAESNAQFLFMLHGNSQQN